MMFVQTWGEMFSRSLQGIWFGIASFVPSLVIAIIIFVIGWVLASLVEKLVETIFKSLKVDSALRAAGVEEIVRRAGYNLNSGRFVGTLVRWFVIVVFLVASLEAIGLTQVNSFLQTVVLGYLPQVIVSVLILMVAVIVGGVMQKVVVASARASHIASANFLGSLTKWAIWIFALIAALVQLGIAAVFLQTLFTAVVGALALALGLAFGLGGKDAAAELISKARHEVSDRN